MLWTTLIQKIQWNSSTIIWCQTTPKISYSPSTGASTSVTLRQVQRLTDWSCLHPYPSAITILSVMLSQWLRLINWSWPQLRHIADLLMSAILIIACALRFVYLLKHQPSCCSAILFATSTYDPICVDVANKKKKPLQYLYNWLLLDNTVKPLQYWLFSHNSTLLQCSCPVISQWCDNATISRSMV